MSNFTCHTRKTGACPICAEYAKGCKTQKIGKPDILTYCRKISPGTQIPGYIALGDGGGGLWQMYKQGEVNRGWTDEEKAAHKAEKAERERQYERDRQEHNAGLSDDNTRHREYQRDIKKYGLNDRDRQEMIRRGMTPDQFEGWAYSVGSVCHLTVVSPQGLMVGHQVKTYNSEAKYVWGRGGQHQRRSTGEQPMTHLGNRKNPKEIHFVESTGFKPKIHSDGNPEVYVVGASGNQFVTSKTELAELLDRHPQAKLVYCADGGACKNLMTEGLTVKLYEFCKQHDGREMEYVWYGQFEKSDGDIDEILASTKIKRISHDKFMSISRNYRQHVKLTQMSKPAEKISSRYLPAIAEPDLGSILFVLSAVGTGKTEQMRLLIEQHLAKYPNSRVISISYRNGLNDQSSKRWGITSYRVGHGKDHHAIQSLRKLAIVSDSLCNLELSSIPANSLVILDECEAGLKHITRGETTGSLTAKVQAHFTQVLDRVLVSSGKIVALEDSITDTVIDGLLNILENRYPYKVISNDYDCFNYDVNIGTGSKSDYIALILARLQIGEKILITSTSQVFIEILERMAIAGIPSTKGFLERLDSKTVGTKGDLISDPVAYLVSAKAKMVQLSPTVESGFSIDDKDLEEPLFDRVMAYFPNLDTRAHIQLLSRYRANCPRDIFIPDRGAEGNNNGSTNPDTIYKMWMQTALETSMQTGNGAVKMSPEAIAWNRLNANFQARQNISYLYSKSLLKSNLQSRGHKCVDADWAKIALEVYTSNGLEVYDTDEIKQSFDAIKGEIDAEQALALAIANPGNMTREAATMILKSSSSAPAQKVIAQKCLLQMDLPGADLTEEFLLESIVKDRGRYRKQCELAFILGKRELASAIDKDLFGKQLDQPHITLRRCPKNLQTVNLFAPIADELAALISGIEYREADTVIAKVNNHLIKSGYTIKRLLGISMLAAADGNAQSSAIANVNKILKKLGYRSERVHQYTEGKNRVGVYAVVNHDCVHRSTIYQALEVKYKEYLSSLHRDSSDKDAYIESQCIDDTSAMDGDSSESVEDLAEGLRWIVEHPEDCGSLRSTTDKIKLKEASKLLSESERSTLKNIVTDHNNRAA